MRLLSKFALPNDYVTAGRCATVLRVTGSQEEKSCHSIWLLSTTPTTTTRRNRSDGDGEGRGLYEPVGGTFDIADRFSARQDGDGRPFEGEDRVGSESGVREETTAEPRERRDGLNDVEVVLSDGRRGPQRASSDVLYSRRECERLGLRRSRLAGHVESVLVLLAEGTIANEGTAADSCVPRHGRRLV